MQQRRQDNWRRCTRDRRKNLNAQSQDSVLPAEQMAEAAARVPRGNGITIRDAEMPDPAPNGGSAEAAAAAPEQAQDARLEADGDYARQLQAKLDAEEARGGAEGRCACAWAQNLLLNYLCTMSCRA